jgi:hypothetical protein
VAAKAARTLMGFIIAIVASRTRLPVLIKPPRLRSWSEIS